MTSDHPVKRRKKLIEVAIPLEAINAASAREKSIRHGHPSTLHLWWAPRPLAAARAVIFCQLVDDPSAVPEEFATEEEQEKERLRLFALISELAQWESTTNEEVLGKAREEICRSWRRCCAENADHPEAAELFNPEKLPSFHDPFAGGGALPLEAQRLGLESYASDLNPVAVLINKAKIEIPSKFAGMPSINPEARRDKQLFEQEWKGAEGLAEDVRYYGKWMRDEAEKRIGYLYPKIEITKEMVTERSDLEPYQGKELTVIAWIWARTVKSPDPAFSDTDVPLITTYWLSSKKGKEVYLRPIIEGKGYRFEICVTAPENPEEVKIGLSAGRWNAFKCLVSGVPITYEYIRQEGCAGRIGSRLLAAVVSTGRGRAYLSASQKIEESASIAHQGWAPDLDINYHPRDIKMQIYGITKYSQLFTPRQLVTLCTFSDLVAEARNAVEGDLRIMRDVRENAASQWPLAEYADSLSIYLGINVSKATRFLTSLSVWRADEGKLSRSFGRQAIQMTWDFAETNPFSDSGGDLAGLAYGTADALDKFTPIKDGHSLLADAAYQDVSLNKVVSTDPPYYDNICYADLSDYFYVWLRKCLRPVAPRLFETIATPKEAELIANPYRHGSRESAESHFLEGMKKAIGQISLQASKAFPITIYYAFKQAEVKSRESTALSTGWETFLEAIVSAGLSVIGTWPIRTEGATRVNSKKSNALASSIVIVCQPRSCTAPILSRQEFRRELRKEIPIVMKELELANIAPVDVAQAVIGPAMAIYSGAKAVLNSDDSLMKVREALAEINAALDEHLSSAEGGLDTESRFALTFFESFGYAERDFGDAEGLAKARNTSVDGVAKAGILRSVAGKVKLLHRSDLQEDWDPSKDKRLCVWESTQQLINRLEADGESSAAALLLQLKKIGSHGDLAANCRALAYRLYNHCEKTKQAEEARSYNGLVIAWPELERQASAAANAQSAPLQTSLI
jgi:putative DNA methylase